MKKQIRQPIVTICGHVDHGKTSILDRLRGSSVQEGEKGGITQKISFTLFPAEQIRSACHLIDKEGLELHIPGFLFIDTPGHAAFTNLRKRGGSLADLAVLVIDINDGIKPQTAEVIKILKHNKTPFIIALNKIDNVSGWRTPKEIIGIKENIESQPQNVKETFNERYLTLIGSLNSYGFDADLFYNIEDFSKKIALIPTSARTKEGIPELTMMLCGLSQKYLEKGLDIKDDAKGIILEVKKEKSMNYAECILYDGKLAKNDTIAIANINGEPIVSKIRILEEIKPLSDKFQAKKNVIAATGLRIQLTTKEKILPGMPFVIYKDNDKEIESSFKKELQENIKTEKKGIIAKADSLGSLEALLTLLGEQNIPVVKAGIGDISKSDIISAKANLDINELDAVIVGFNVKKCPDVEKTDKIEIFTEEVVYKLIENVAEFRKEKQKEIEKKRIMELTTLCKIKNLHEYVFRNTSPAIFGVRIEKGKLRSRLKLINENGDPIGKTKNIQSENKSVEEANEGMEVALSIPGVNVERQLKTINNLYSEISESQFKKFKKNKDLLSRNEIQILQEIAEIKRKKRPEWGT